jgi:hypothetical protein
VIGAVRAVLRRGFELTEQPFDTVFGPSLNPLKQLGALGFFFFWIVTVSGVYLFIFFDTGIEKAYESVEYMTVDHWYHAGVMRSLHRYASDLMVVMVLIHLLREFAYDHYRGSFGCSLPVVSPDIGWYGIASPSMSLSCRPNCSIIFRSSVSRLRAISSRPALSPAAFSR